MTADRLNDLGQPIGEPLPGWVPPPFPPRESIVGRFCRLEPLDVGRHAESLFAAYSLDIESRNWTYLPYGPFKTLADFRDWIGTSCSGDDPFFLAIVDPTSALALGVTSFCRIDPDSGSIEVGHIHYSEPLKRSPIATEAMFLMMSKAFELGYRRYEWKCDALNASSRAAAQRLGFSHEGVFRQAKVYKGHSRDTAWYSITDAEWPALQKAFLTWLDPDNFDSNGGQRSHLSELTSPLLRQAD